MTSPARGHKSLSSGKASGKIPLPPRVGPDNTHDDCRAIIRRLWSERDLALADCKAYDEANLAQSRRIAELEAELRAYRIEEPIFIKLRDARARAEKAEAEAEQNLYRARKAEKAYDELRAEVERLTDALWRIKNSETEIPGLKPEYYGHAAEIARKALSGVNPSGDTLGAANPAATKNVVLTPTGWQIHTCEEGRDNHCWKCGQQMPTAARKERAP